MPQCNFSDEITKWSWMLNLEFLHGRWWLQIPILHAHTNRPQDRVLGVQMPRRYGTGELAGTHSAIYPCTIPSLVSSTTPTDSKCYWKHTQKQLGFRAFSNSTPNLWNALPHTIREADSSATFRRRLKTHLFSDWLFIFSVCWTHCAPKLFLGRLFLSIFYL